MSSSMLVQKYTKVITSRCIRVIVSQVFLASYLQVVIIDTIVMETGDDKSVPIVPHSCAAHDYDLMKPVVLATWKHGFQGACPDKSAILAESQVQHFFCFYTLPHYSVNQQDVRYYFSILYRCYINYHANCSPFKLVIYAMSTASYLPI